MINHKNIIATLAYLIAHHTLIMAYGPGDVPKEFIAQFLPKNPIILEAGAHNGDDTLTMSKLWPSATIYAFEPIPDLFDRLKEKTKHLHNVFCFSYALSDALGEAEMYVSCGEGDGSSSLLEPKEHLIDHPTITFNKKVRVKTTTVDQWARANHITHIDLLCLDLQGHELTVLKAMPDLLKTVTVIYTEVNLCESYKGTALYPELKAWLESQGFSMEREEIPWKDGGNVLFVRK